MAKFITFSKLVDRKSIFINMDTVKTIEPVNRLFDGHMMECADIYYENHRVTVLSSIDEITDIISGMEDGDIVSLVIDEELGQETDYNYDQDTEFTENITDPEDVPNVTYDPEEEVPPVIWTKTVRVEHSNDSNGICNHITLPLENEWSPAFPSFDDGPYFRTFTADKVLPADQDFVYVVYKCHYKSQGGKRPYRNRRLHNAYPVKIFIEKQDAVTYINTNNSGVDVDTTGIKYIGVKQPFDGHYKLLLGYIPTGNTLYTMQHGTAGASYGDEYF